MRGVAGAVLVDEGEAAGCCSCGAAGVTRCALQSILGLRNERNCTKDRGALADDLGDNTSSNTAVPDVQKHLNEIRAFSQNKTASVVIQSHHLVVGWGQVTLSDETQVGVDDTHDLRKLTQPSDCITSRIKIGS